MIFEPTSFHLQKGDIIKSKKGFLEQHPITKETFLVFETEYLGNNRWIAKKKESIIVKKIKELKVKKE